MVMMMMQNINESEITLMQHKIDSFTHPIRFASCLASPIEDMAKILCASRFKNRGFIILYA